MNEEQTTKIIENLAHMEEQIKTLFKQQAEIKELTETVQKLAIALEKQGMSLQSQGQKLDGVKSDVDEIKSKPGKRWDTVIAAVISALVGFFLARLGLIG